MRQLFEVSARRPGRLPVLAAVLLLTLLLGACSNGSVLSTNADDGPGTNTVPWDYRIQAGEVGDLVGSDMTLLPDNELLPNDANYATGQKVWTLQSMSAALTTDDQGRNDVQLSGWTTLKSYPDEAAAQADLENLKVSVTTDVDVVGVYRTAYNGETRSFAVVELPSGNRIKQPVDDARYGKLKDAKTASVVLEEVHDFADYDLAYAKFRGWAN
ncbi:signal peptide protein [Saccharibacillus sp. CPCC 101409]|uniref:signal peptide protein n=1 Tax=Saccharibacillus sp. CPCC 101409 TaxID=3058041 RepID=UPI002670D34F|nr:signal peptide protein [Saccharibacillus sp. CPCC 101409]MDO3409955.1 signal peptide protein [Saccharibacillus sp. CPCC 101409]